LPSRRGRPRRWCALTAPFQPCLCVAPGSAAIGGLFSVALTVRSLRPGSRQHPALWSPDLPRPRVPPQMAPRSRGHPDDSPAAPVNHPGARTRNRAGWAGPDPMFAAPMDGWFWLGFGWVGWDLFVGFWMGECGETAPPGRVGRGGHCAGGRTDRRRAAALRPSPIRPSEHRQAVGAGAAVEGELEARLIDHRGALRTAQDAGGGGGPGGPTGAAGGGRVDHDPCNGPDR
jgi:hypothetical protein